MHYYYKIHVGTFNFLEKSLIPGTKSNSPIRATANTIVDPEPIPRAWLSCMKINALSWDLCNTVNRYFIACGPALILGGTSRAIHKGRRVSKWSSPAFFVHWLISRDFAYQLCFCHNARESAHRLSILMLTVTDQELCKAQSLKWKWVLLDKKRVSGWGRYFLAPIRG